MSDRIKTKVDNGDLLNYDACFQDSLVSNLASQNQIIGDDINLSLSKDRLCRIYYNNGFWRGSINKSIDDRISSNVKTIWNKQSMDKSLSAVYDAKANFNNLINPLRQFTIAYKLYNQDVDLSNIRWYKTKMEYFYNTIVDETRNLGKILDILKNENSDAILHELKDNEEKIRFLKKDNEKYRLGNELRREQAKDLYEKYDSNYHSSIFGYSPINSSNQSYIIFISFLIGIIGLIVGGIQIANFITNPSSIQYIKEKPSQLIKKLNLRY